MAHRQVRIFLTLILLGGTVGFVSCGASGLFSRKKTVRVNLGQELFKPQGDATADYGAVEGYVYQPIPGSTEEGLIVLTSEEVPEDGHIEGYTPVAEATVEVANQGTGPPPPPVTTNEEGFFHIVVTETPPDTEVEVTVQPQDSEPVEVVVQTQSVPLRRSFFRRRVRIPDPDLPGYVEVDLRDITLRATLYNDGQDSVQGTLFYLTLEEYETAGLINKDNVQELAVPFYTFHNPEDPFDTFLEPGESWEVTEGQIEGFQERPEGAPAGPSMRDLINQAPTDIYVFGLLHPETANISVRDAEVLIKARGGLDPF